MIKLKSLFRRGQGPSGSKHSSQSTTNIAATNGTTIKAASSALSLDRVGVSAAASASKQGRALHGSRDKLDQYSPCSQHRHFRGTKERLSDAKFLSKEQSGARNLSILHPMPLIQPQYSADSPSPRSTRQPQHFDNLDKQNDDEAYSITSEEIVIPKDMTAINFNGPMEELKPHRKQELQTLLGQLKADNAALEKKVLEMSFSQNQDQALRDEIMKLQALHEASRNELHRLHDENKTLRDHLQSIVQSPLSDNEKQQIIRDSQRLHSSAPASIALPNTMDVEGTPCVTPDWDKQSSSSEIAVACLQDKITQYSLECEKTRFNV